MSSGQFAAIKRAMLSTSRIGSLQVNTGTLGGESVGTCLNGRRRTELRFGLREKGDPVVGVAGCYHSAEEKPLASRFIEAALDFIEELQI